ncbi:AraC family transcriptional regulator ligand-binding domain-containing protein [Pantanalinema rosaneae CENA516]|uniref:AraC family transcriptional regulator ligand-binding domain-containing protein n=1 Tax=Pantanalinema rosaneae TaxID=1620701 RepID=UPI003D6DE764
MTYIPLIRANVMHGVMALLQQLDAPTDRLLAEAKLPLSVLHEPEALLPLKQVLQFMENAALTMEVEPFGLLAGQQTHIANLGALGRLLCHSLTLQSAINTLICLMPSYNSGDRIWLKPQGEIIWLCRHFTNGLEHHYPQAVQWSVVCLIHLIQLAADSQWQPIEIHLAIAPTPGFDQIAVFANTKVLFNQEATAIAVPKTFLSLPLRNSEQYGKHQQDQDYQALYSSAPATNFPASLRQILGVHLKQGYPSIQSIAEILGVSVRSFQRQLNHANLTYSQLIEQVRLEYSVQRLRDPTTKIADIAAEIGYTDAGNFARAFKRWTGVSPKTYSIRHLKPLF